jgi:hypothetical protein
MNTGPTTPRSNPTAIPPAEPPGTTDLAGSGYGDPVGELVRAAVADRPLEDIAHLITLLEQSPEYADATVAALRAVGVDRSVEDVTRLVTLLTRPPRDVAGADEAIRAAVECRPVADVTQLLALLHRTPLEPHCGEDAVRAAAAGRLVEELVDLIGRLAEERQAAADLLEPGSAQQPTGAETGAGADSDPLGPGAVPARPTHSPDTPRRPAGPELRPARLAVLALVVCGVLNFPLQRGDATARVYAIALGAAVLCVSLALILAVRPTVPTLAAGGIVPAALAAGQLFEGRLVHSAGLSRALDLALAPALLAGTAGVVASLAALTSLFARLPWQPPRAGTPRPMAEANRATD